MSFQETFDIDYYYHHYCYCRFIHCWQEKVLHNSEEKLIKVSHKRGKIIYLYKSVNINFFIAFKILSKFQESSCGKVK